MPIRAPTIFGATMVSQQRGEIRRYRDNKSLYSLKQRELSDSPKFTPKQMTWVNILAVLNKQVGRQAIKKIVFFE
ncbi:MAG: hypothetical protein EZS28_030537 [Streblomastix strix]|uniref:Uncharacterized protein n=1 Tax=Streblomastix strix TaxID=222440 RepID=A0A5J4UVY1_9EUKA|nr:MAG: hypothetical protein EZS28_030537 [Streblomastix strix]